MSQTYTNPRQFLNQFKVLSKQAWLENLRTELDENQLNQYTTGHQHEGLTILPFYAKEDLPAGIDSLYNTNAPWRYHEYLQITDDVDLKTLHTRIRKSLEAGVQGVDIHWLRKKPFSLASAQFLLAELLVDELSIALHFPEESHFAETDLLNHLLEQQIKLSLYIAPGIHPGTAIPHEPIGEWIRKYPQSGLCTLGISSLPFANQGGHVVQELAFTLSYWVDCLDKLTEDHIALEDTLNHSEFSLATQENYFINIAKFRAIRTLLAQVADTYGADQAYERTFTVKAVSGMRNKTVYDPVSNILRNTSEAIGAVVGGCDALSLISHDFAYRHSGNFGARMSRNISNLLMHEAHMDKVSDPAAGSFFLENITRQLVERAWELFLAMEEKGGYSELRQNGWITQQLTKSYEDKLKGIHTRKQVIVGASRYINHSETIDASALIDLHSNTMNRRQAYSFERMRLAVDQYFLQTHERLSVSLIIFPEGQSAALINARTAFIQDLLYSAGLEVQLMVYDEAETFPLPTEEGSVWIMCGTHDFYQQKLPGLLERWVTASVPSIYLAGKPNVSITENSSIPYQGFIYAGADMVAILAEILRSKNIQP